MSWVKREVMYASADQVRWCRLLHVQWRGLALGDWHYLWWDDERLLNKEIKSRILGRTQLRSEKKSIPRPKKVCVRRTIWRPTKGLLLFCPGMPNNDLGTKMNNDPYYFHPCRQLRASAGKASITQWRKIKLWISRSFEIRGVIPSRWLE